jgi:hypothetical protein
MRAILVLLGLALLTVPAHGASQVTTKALTIRVVSTSFAVKMLVDSAPKGAGNAGDTVRVRFALRNARPQFGKPNGALVGSAVAIYTFESRNFGTVTVTTTLPGGTIRSSDRHSYAGCCATEGRVTGGTGVYAGARGTLRSEHFPGHQMVSLPLPQGERLNIYRLQLP